ncbi:MAG TPA: hypothetical protein VGC07_05210 [Granulicella sp.]
MEVNVIIAGIDAQIQKLQEARKILESVSAPQAVKGVRGRPKGSKTAAVKVVATPAARRKLSPEGRKRIAEAMKRRWAERRKTSAKAPAKAAAK